MATQTQNTIYVESTRPSIMFAFKRTYIRLNKSIKNESDQLRWMEQCRSQKSFKLLFYAKLLSRHKGSTRSKPCRIKISPQLPKGFMLIEFWHLLHSDSLHLL